MRDKLKKRVLKEISISLVSLVFIVASATLVLAAVPTHNDPILVSEYGFDSPNEDLICYNIYNILDSS